MTDYNYSDHRVTLNDSDSGKNNASSLGGYSLDINPQQDWPGTSADPNSQRLDTDKMNDVADAIDGLVSTLQNSGANELPAQAAVSFGPQSWEAAVYLQEACKEVSHGVQQYTTKLIANLQAASAAIRGAAGGYNGAEHANTQGAANQQHNLDTSSQAF